jgi:DNA-binding NarL/FixJ family response regulator
MVVKRSKQLAILKRRRDVAELYLQGWTQTAIAEEMGVAQPTISDDVKHIRAQWRSRACGILTRRGSWN